MELIPVAFANSLVARLNNLLTFSKGVLLIHWSRKPEVYSTTCTRKCHPHGFPFLCHLEDADEHVEVSLETSYEALAPWSEVSRNIEDASDPSEI